MNMEEFGTTTTTRRPTTTMMLSRGGGGGNNNNKAGQQQEVVVAAEQKGAPEKNKDEEEAAFLLEKQQKESAATVSNVLAGLTVAGMAASLLTTIFGIFHVDVFLVAYALPVTTYSAGNIIFGIINAANDVAGAYIIDQIATTRKRSDLVGITGWLFALSFLTPFFRPWMEASNWFWDGAHFVLSLSLYDTMYSFAMILYGSIVSDDHEMTEKARVRFLAICKVVNLVASFGVTRLGLYLFDTQHLESFRFFVLAVFATVCMLSVVSQNLVVDADSAFSMTHFCPKKVEKTEKAPKSTRSLQWRRVVKDFWEHKNFRAWIGMELLLESQNSFNLYFRKTFVDRLVAGNGVDKETCDWLLSITKPLTAVVSLAIFIPIRKFGYPKVYRFLFASNLVFSTIMLLIADEASANSILAFLFVYPIFTQAVLSAGFPLGMADMVMDMKYQHANQGRYDGPSLAGMFMGANALFTKPSEAILPIIAAQAMKDEASAQQNLFYVLVLPPLIFSCLQLWSWHYYDLEPKKVSNMRHELKKLLSSQSDIEDGS